MKRKKKSEENSHKTNDDGNGRYPTQSKVAKFNQKIGKLMSFLGKKKPREVSDDAVLKVRKKAALINFHKEKGSYKSFEKDEMSTHSTEFITRSKGNFFLNGEVKTHRRGDKIGGANLKSLNTNEAFGNSVTENSFNLINCTNLTHPYDPISLKFEEETDSCMFNSTFNYQPFGKGRTRLQSVGNGIKIQDSLVLREEDSFNNQIGHYTLISGSRCDSEPRRPRRKRSSLGRTPETNLNDKIKDTHYSSTNPQFNIEARNPSLDFVQLPVTRGFNLTEDGMKRYITAQLNEMDKRVNKTSIHVKDDSIVINVEQRTCQNFASSSYSHLTSYCDTPKIQYDLGSNIHCSDSNHLVETLPKCNSVTQKGSFFQNFDVATDNDSNKNTKNPPENEQNNPTPSKSDLKVHDYGGHESDSNHVTTYLAQDIDKPSGINNETRALEVGRIDVGDIEMTLTENVYEFPETVQNLNVDYLEPFKSENSVDKCNIGDGLKLHADNIESVCSSLIDKNFETAISNSQLFNIITPVNSILDHTDSHETKCNLTLKGNEICKSKKNLCSTKDVNSKTCISDIPSNCFLHKSTGIGIYPFFLFYSLDKTHESDLHKTVVSPQLNCNVEKREKIYWKPKHEFLNLYKALPPLSSWFSCPTPFKKFVKWCNPHEVWTNMISPNETFTHETQSYIKKHKYISGKSRAILIDWLAEVCDAFRLKRETYYKAVDYTDRYLSAFNNIRCSELQLVGITALYISSKLEEIFPPSLNKFAGITDGATDAEEISLQEVVMLETLDWELDKMTAYCWLSLFTQSFQYSTTKDSDKCSQVKKNASFFKFQSTENALFEIPDKDFKSITRVTALLEIAILDEECLKYSPIVLAGSVFFLTHGSELINLKHTGMDFSILCGCIKWLQIYYNSYEVIESITRSHSHKIKEESYSYQSHRQALAKMKELNEFRMNSSETMGLC